MKTQAEFDIVPKKENITYGFDKKCLTIVEKLDNGKTREVYWIEKSRCRTIEKQFDWILHMNGKNWINGYDFKNEFAAAIRLWAHEDNNFANAIKLKAKQ